jgi:DNA-directed RNA polymerase
MREIHNDPNAIIKTPVFLDATCSGVQHFAGLMKDLELGTNTNLIPSTNEDKPGDIYSILLDPINSAINKFGLDKDEYSMLSLVKLTRKEVKTSIMTKVYNVTVYGISHQLQSIFETIFIKDSGQKSDSLNKEEVKEGSFENKFYENTLDDIQETLKKSLKSNKDNTKFICPAGDGKKITLTKKEIYKIASIINEQIFVVFPSLNNIYNYFIDISKLTIKLGIPLT